MHRATTHRLQGQDITVAFARVRDQVLDRLGLKGVEAAVGPANFHERITDGMRAWQWNGSIPNFVPLKLSGLGRSLIGGASQAAALRTLA